MLNKSLEFLWTVRNQLHWLSGRKQEDLSFELQEKIAPLLGFSCWHKRDRRDDEAVSSLHQKISKLCELILLDHVLYEPSRFKKAFFFFKRRKIG